MNYTPALHTFLVTLAYTVFGLVIFGIAFWIITKLVPFSIRKEIEDDQNTALAIVIGAVLLGLAIIIASTIHG
jgi:putative membrane protein